jgi:hypothetical protein
VLIEAGDAAAAVSVEVFDSVLVFADLGEDDGVGLPVPGRGQAQRCTRSGGVIVARWKRAMTADGMSWVHVCV